MKNEQLKIKIKKVILSPKSGRNPEKIRKKSEEFLTHL